MRVSLTVAVLRRSHATDGDAETAAGTGKVDKRRLKRQNLSLRPTNP
jgi:hypothetical protein